MNRIYLCIDLKSFYASVECVELGLDPLTTNLVVADESRTEKTICLAVTPSLKSYGIPGRARLFEVIQKAKSVNQNRRYKAPNRTFTGKSSNASELNNNPALEFDYIVARPRMALYKKYSLRINEIYLKYVSKDDILVYSIDEVFMDITGYLKPSGKTPHDFAMMIIRDVLKTTGITATAGIGTNMYLAKIAMDITAKKMAPDKDGVRIASLDEMSYRRELWEHKPLTDFWRVGKGISKKLEDNRMYTMGDIARASTTAFGRKTLKKLFGINSKMLVDHAWGYEPTTIEEANKYVPDTKSLSSGQVLHEPYTFEKARIIVWEMMELLSLDLVAKGYVTDHIVLTVEYDKDNLIIPEIARQYNGKIKVDRYGREIPEPAHGTTHTSRQTSSTKLLSEATLNLYDDIVDKKLLIRKINISVCNLIKESNIENKQSYEQLDLFTDYDELMAKREKEENALKKERKIQEAMLDIKERYGKNAILKGTNLQESATTIERNESIGGHKA